MNGCCKVMANGFLCFVLVAGLEDSTMGTVADTVARVLRGCLENMPEGMRLYSLTFISGAPVFNIIPQVNWIPLLIS